MADLLGSVKQSFDRRQMQQPPQPQQPGYDVERGHVQLLPTGAAHANLDPSMNKFFADVEAINAEIALIKGQQQDITQMHEASKSLVKSREVQRQREVMQERINNVNQIALRVKAKVQMLDRENEASKQIKGQGDGTATERTRTSITAGLKKKLKDQMGEFSSLRTQIHDDYRTVVGRRVYTVTGQQLQEEEVDAIIERGQEEQIIQQALVSGQDRARVENTLAEIKERHQGVVELERSLVELHQIFLDMAVLVEAQGAQLDNIGQQVGRAADYVGGGAVQLQEAKTYQTKSRKLMMWTCLILTIIAIIVILAVVLTIKPWQ